MFKVVEELNLYPDWEIAMCYVFFGINALACLVCGGWIYANRASKQVKAWQVRICAYDMCIGT